MKRRGFSDVCNLALSSCKSSDFEDTRYRLGLGRAFGLRWIAGTFNRVSLMVLSPDSGVIGEDSGRSTYFNKTI